MRFFLDNCVPEAVALVLIEAGHEVIRQREAIAIDASDPLVALASAENDAILVSLDKDFKGIATRYTVKDTRLRNLSRVHLRCDGAKAAARVQSALSFLESEWKIAQESADQRMFVEIQKHGFRTVR